MPRPACLVVVLLSVPCLSPATLLLVPGTNLDPLALTGAPRWSVG